MTWKNYAAFILVSNIIPPSKTSCVLMQVPTTQAIIFRLAMETWEWGYLWYAQAVCYLVLSLLCSFLLDNHIQPSSIQSRGRRVRKSSRYDNILLFTTGVWHGTRFSTGHQVLTNVYFFGFDYIDYRKFHVSSCNITLLFTNFFIIAKHLNPERGYLLSSAMLEGNTTISFHMQDTGFPFSRRL